MKFEQPPQFNPEKTIETRSVEKNGVPAREKIAEKPKPPEFKPESPKQSIDKNESNKTEELETEKILPNQQEKTEASTKNPPRLVQGRQEIVKMGREIREYLNGQVTVENLSALAKQAGIKYVIKTPLLRMAGANGLTQQLENGSTIILYHGILPGTDEYYLSHEIGHVLSGHLFVERRGIKQGLREEWDADTFASAVTKLPQPLAILYCHIVDGLIGKIYKVFGPIIKKREIKKISDQLGYYPEELKDAFK